MILTINVNAALDRTMFIDAFEPTTVMRPERVVESIGGKGLDTSVALQSLGVRHIAMSLWPARPEKRWLNCSTVMASNMIWFGLRGTPALHT